MASLKIYNVTGKEVGTIDVDPAEIAPRINKQLLHDAVVMYQANLRQGSFATKSRAQVAGSTKKMYRQKGTGNARAGSKRSGIRRGGGHIFAKKPRDFSYRLPRKALQLATRMAVAMKIQEEAVTIVDELSFAEPKTREMAAAVKALGLDGKTLLLAVERHDANVYKSTRNIDKVSILPVADLNAYAVLRPRHLVLTKAAWEAFRENAKSDAAAPRETVAVGDEGN